ncbi:SCO2400 family protein [Streptomyces sp. 1222.5]|uniref:SCO2400 family protein n=1 Tax=Streptomyces sp. 1222.5 TaxID=1881026 RepID=UPI003EB88129
MDYCSSCRRHLNGALVCPGCGAYAPDIAPPLTDRAVRTDGLAGPARHTGGFEARYAGPPAEDTAHRDAFGAPVFEPSPDTVAAPVAALASEAGVAPAYEADVEDAPSAPATLNGRAARRRQLARWKKSKRRAAVATAFAIVGGGLTLATMDRNSGDRAQAATAPDHRSMGVAGEQSVDPTRPASAPPAPHRPDRAATPTAHPPATNAPREQTLSAAPRTAVRDSRPQAAEAPRAVVHDAPQPRSAPRSDSGTTSDGTTAAPAPASTPATSTGGSTGGTDSGTPATAPAPASTSPTQLCLVLLCIG